MTKLIATGSLSIDGMSIPVNIHNIRKDFGMTRYTISPVGGQGRVDKEAVKVEHWENETYREIYTPLIK